MHFAFSEKEVRKCSTLNFCFSTDFHRKAVLTPQECEDYFFGKKIKKKLGEKIQKPVGGVSSSQDWSQKNPLAKRFFFRKCTFCANTPK